MKKRLIFVAAMATLMLPAICSATPPRPGPYVSGFAGVSVPRDADVTATDFSTGDVFDDRVEFDPGFYVGGTGGFDFGFLRLEGEISYRDSEIKGVTSLDGSRFHDTDGDLGALAVMANAFFDLHNQSPITPYFGGGIGFASLHLGDTSGFDQTGQLTHLYPGGDDTVFAYQAGAGLEIALNPKVSLDVGYRYFGTAKPNFESGSVSTDNMKLESHNAMVGVRVKF